MSQTIAHYDLDYFFVAVEELLDPSLKGKPVILGGKERGVVTTCNYEARKYGVHSAMPGARAYQLCPHGIFLKGNYHEYSRFSRMVTDIIRAEAPVFEKASVDEFYVDISGMEKYHNPLQWAIGLRKKIIKETGLPISCGIASNKMVAKIATNIAKPDNYKYVPPGTEKEFLAPLKLEEIPGVGKHSLSRLHALKLFKIADVHEAGEALIHQNLGNFGDWLYKKCMGIHTGRVDNFHEAKSISAENTFFENITDSRLLEAELVRLIDKVCFELRSDGKVASCVAVKIRFPNFETQTRQTMVPRTLADDEIIPTAKNLLKKLHENGTPVRLLGVRLSDLSELAIQSNLFEATGKKSDLYKAIDQVKNRFGKSSVKRASSG